ncbi:SGNH/GDSL hydrolase family protein, partial [Candidatus Omnitrophota bacterium]
MKTKPLLRKILLIPLGIFMLLVVLEGSLRIGGYLYTRYRNPETYAKISEPKKEEFTILCLGDSFTEGLGAGRDKSYPRQLERILRENAILNINVINEGRSASTSSMLLKRLPEDIDRHDPDIIIVMTGVNNHWNFEDSSYFLINKKG